MFHKKLLFTAASAAVAIPLLLIAEEKVDLSIIHRIRSEAFENSKVMEHMFWLTDVHGPRLTNSPGYRSAADWVVKQMKDYGIPAKLEKFPFGRSWTYTHFEAHLIEPQYAPLIGFPLAWTPGTNGTVIGEPMVASIRTEADMEKWKGKLKGKIVLSAAARDLDMHLKADGTRWSDDDLAKESMAPEPGALPFGRPRAGGPGGPGESQTFQQMREFRNKLNKFMSEEAPAVVVQPGTIGDGGTVFAIRRRFAG